MQHCCAEWHLAKLQSHVAALIYSLALQLTKKSGVFFLSAPQLSAYLNSSDRTVRRALHSLVECGLFEVVDRTNGFSVQYRPVVHKDWSTHNPGRCFEG